MRMAALRAAQRQTEGADEWEKYGYDEDGCWDEARAADALRATHKAREDAKRARRPRARQS